jgi:hypothetical protein
MGRRLLLKRLLKNRALGTRSWNPHLALSLHQFCSHSLIGSAPAFELLLCLAFILLSGQRLTSRVCVPYNFFSHCRDAAWELEPGAFSELYQRYRHCDAPICLYEQGRDSFEDEG